MSEEPDKVKVIVSFKQSAISSKGFQNLSNKCLKLGASVLSSNTNVDSVTCSATRDCVARLRKDPDVEEVYEVTDKDVHISELEPPYKSTYDYPNNKKINYGAMLAGCVSKNGQDKAWLKAGGESVHVFIVDTGAGSGHGDLPYSTGFNASSSPNLQDANSHGTHVAGIACGKGAVKVKGIAPEAYLHAVKVLDDNGFGGYDNILNGLAWIFNNFQTGVVNMSLGGTRKPPVAMQRMIQEMVQKGFLIVCAAGNDGGPTNYPAAYPECISISAIDPKLKITSWSSRGKVEFAHAGLNVYSTLPNNKFGFKSGTSMSSPQVAGTLALIWSANIGMKAHEVLSLATEKAFDVGQQGKDSEYGYGVCYAGFVSDATPPTPEPEPEPDEVKLTIITSSKLPIKSADRKSDHEVEIVAIT